ncbi:MAG: hypothetical protein QW451_02700 [Candidatus Aenigmatarchaeota archaeon]
MEKKEILNLFTKKGLILDSKTLDFFTENQELIEVFFERIKGLQLPPVIKTDFIHSIVGKKEEVLFEEIKKEVFDKDVVSIEDVSTILTERYNKLQKFFTNRLELVNLISVNKISEKMKKFSLIVMVREIDREEKSVLVEDLTGEVRIKVKEEFLNVLMEDEVIGVICEKNNGIEAVNLLWPDIPLKKTIPKIEEEVLCVFLHPLFFQKDFEAKIEKFKSKIRELNFKKNYIFFFSENEELVEKVRGSLPFNWELIVITNKKFSKDLKNTYVFLSPVYLNFSKKLIMLLVSGEIISEYQKVWKMKNEEVMLNLLKKRCLGKFNINKVKEDLIIDPVPDIFVSYGFGSSSSINYKGTTIISCGLDEEKMFWIVNLATRETLKINLD